MDPTGMTVEQFAVVCFDSDATTLRADFGEAFLLQRDSFSADQRMSWAAFSTLIVSGKEARNFTGPPKGSFKVFGIPREGSQGFSKWVTIGRQRSNCILINHESVSKLHAFFIWKEDKFTLFDAGSKNGTWLNDEPVGCYGKKAGSVVTSGDLVRFGGTDFMFLSPEEIFRLFNHWKPAIQ